MTTPPLAIVAGAGPGMGAAIARRFALGGMRLALVSRDPGRLAPLVGSGGEVSTYAADLSEIDETRRVIAGIVDDLGPAAALVYNGALWRQAPAATLDPLVFHRDLALDVTSALACAQQVHAGMAAQRSGTILLTGGGLALRPELGVGVSSLTAGKAALRALGHVLAGEWRDDGIHVATVTIAGQVAPGSAFDPDVIAEHYWQLHIQQRSDWEIERIFRG